MKKNNLSWILGLLFVMALGVASCSDEFNEEEFIQKQADLAESKAAADHQRALEVIQAQLQATLAAIEAQKEADTELAQLQAMLQQELQMLMQSLQDKEDSTAAANYLAAYRAAGLFTEFTVAVNNRDGEPLADAEVRVSSIADAVTTGANGMAVFTDVVVGNNTLTVTSDAILDFRANVVFNRLNVETIGTSSIVEPATAMLALNLFAEVASSDEVGTITGTVTIETDLTNDTPEFPTGAVVSADLTNYLMANNVIASENGLGGTSNLALTEGDLGVGEIDPATGNYELTVPVAGNSSNVNLIFPEITADQTLAISERDGNEIPAEIATVPARFNLSTMAEAVPQVRNYAVAINEPTPAGTGFELAFTPRPRELPFINTTSEDLYNEGFNNGSSFNIKIQSGGAGYQFSPALRDSDQDTVGFGYLRGTISAVSIVDGGSGLGATQNYNIFVDFYSGANIVDGFFVGTATTNSTGVISSIELNENAFGVNPDNPWDQSTRIGQQRLDSVVVRDITGGTTDASFSPTLNFILNGLILNDSDNDEYTATNPALGFVGGGASTQAIVATTLKFQYNIAIGNTGTGYTVLPNALGMEGRFAQNNSSFTEGTSEDIFYNVAGSGTQLDQLLDILKLDGNGGIEFINPNIEVWTANVWDITPTTFIDEADRTPMQDFNTGNDDPFEFLFVNADGELNFNQGNFNAGGPYGEPRQITVTERIAGSGGSGYSIDLSESFNSSTGVYSYNNSFTEQNGSGYTDNLNTGTQNPTPGNVVPVTVIKGQTVTRDKDYGTGVRLENVGGDN